MAFPLGKNCTVGGRRNTEYFLFVTLIKKLGTKLSCVGIDLLLTEMALMSLVCPEKVCLQAPSLTSHSLARESQAPEMKVFMSGDRARDMQSPMWLVKMIFCLPVSRSHRQLSRRERGMQSSVEIQWDSASGNASWQVLNAKSFLNCFKFFNLWLKNKK